MMVILLYTTVVTGYLGTALWAWLRAMPASAGSALAWSPSKDSVGSAPLYSRGERIVLLFVWLLHVVLLEDGFSLPDGLHFGFALGLSATMWLAVSLFWVESLFFSIASMRLLILPLAAFCAWLPMWFPGGTALTSAASSQGAIGSPAFDAHLIVALLAYGLLTIAALHALLMAALESWLHRAEPAGSERTLYWARAQRAILGQLPPLMTMERLLFRVVGAGFALLTLTVVTGVFFSEALFGRPMQFDHKTVFTLLAWVIFAALLVGRVGYGWRGRVALRWTLSGFLALLLAYAGSRFVLEVILHRV